jgi:excisionase family DNA binding protein
MRKYFRYYYTNVGTKTQIMEREITVKEAAELLGVSDRRVRALAIAGRIPGARKIHDRMWLIPVEEGEKPVVLPLETRNPDCLQ